MIKIKKTAGSALCILLGAAVFLCPVWAMELEVMGCAVGIELQMDGVLVVDTDAAAEDGQSPAALAGMLPGDMITGVDGRRIGCAADFIDALSALTGEPVAVDVLRGENRLSMTVQPRPCGEDGWVLGLWLRDKVSGIGTVTFRDPATGLFGALGHGVNDADTGVLIPVDSGQLYAAEVTGVNPGSESAPGELLGSFDETSVRGSVSLNTVCGIFGLMGAGAPGELMETAEPEEIRTGAAEIISNVRGCQVERFDVQITRVNTGDSSGRELMLSITDPELLSVTGGVVQGM